MHGTFNKIDHILGHKTYLNKFKRSEVIQSMFIDHKEIKLGAINRKAQKKNPSTWRLNNILLNNPWVQKKPQGKLENTWNENQGTTYQNMQDATKAGLIN